MKIYNCPKCKSVVVIDKRSNDDYIAFCDKGIDGCGAEFGPTRKRAYENFCTAIALNKPTPTAKSIVVKPTDVNKAISDVHALFNVPLEVIDETPTTETFVQPWNR